MRDGKFKHCETVWQLEESYRITAKKLRECSRLKGRIRPKICRNLIRVEILTEKVRDSQETALKCYWKYRLVEKVIWKNCYEGSRSRIHSSCDCVSSREKWNSDAGENGNNAEWVRKCSEGEKLAKELGQRCCKSLWIQSEIRKWL